MDDCDSLTVEMIADRKHTLPTTLMKLAVGC